MAEEKTVIRLSETRSTNDEAKRLARLGAAHGTAVLADCQTAGRGRLGRTFLSPRGGIYLSLILRPTAPAKALRHLTLLFADAAAEAVNAVCGARTEIKWPNDLLLGGKKLAGILTEGALLPDGTWDYLVCGIGMNVAAVPPEVEDIAAALGDENLRPALEKALCAALTEACDHAQDERETRLSRVRTRCVSLGKTIEVHGTGASYRAFAEEILPDGALRVRLPDGTVRSVFSGEITMTEE